jgi:hypothetical protein
MGRRTGQHVIGWKLDRDSRAALLAVLPPRYAHVVADHVTLRARVTASTPPPQPVSCRIVGEADDGGGVQAMVVAIDGATERPGGGTFHITWSLADGREAVESNDVIAEKSWSPVESRDVRVTPAKFP